VPIVKFLPRAEKDLLPLPENLQDEILHKTEMLSLFPLMGQRMEKAYFNYRYLLAGRNQYRIIYRVTSAALVEIAYIRHCRRQMGLRPVHV
jgi:plasmid stabilization system protein ParE